MFHIIDICCNIMFTVIVTFNYNRKGSKPLYTTIKVHIKQFECNLSLKCAPHGVMVSSAFGFAGCGGLSMPLLPSNTVVSLARYPETVSPGFCLQATV